MDLLNQVLTLVTKFAIIGGGLWLVWGVVVLAGRVPPPVSCCSRTSRLYRCRFPQHSGRRCAG